MKEGVYIPLCCVYTFPSGVNMDRKFLEDYLLLQKSITRCEKKLKYYLDHPLVTISGTVMASMQEYPYCLTHYTISATDDPKAEIRRNELIRELALRIANNMREYEEKRVYIDLFIESVEDLTIKEILNQRYLEGKTYEQIGDDLGYEQSTIRKKLDAFFPTIPNTEVVK